MAEKEQLRRQVARLKLRVAELEDMLGKMVGSREYLDDAVALLMRNKFAPAGKP